MKTIDGETNAVILYEVDRLPQLFTVTTDYELAHLQRAGSLFELGFHGHCLLDLWAAAISNLRRKIEAYGIDLFEAIESETGYQTFFTDYDPQKFLPKISCPILYICADPEFGGESAEQVDKILEYLPQLVSVTIKKVDHGLGIHQWEVTPLLHAIMMFLEAI